MQTNKFYLAILTFLIFVRGISAQTPYYFYYNGVKQYLNLDQRYVFFSITDTTRFNRLDIQKSNFRRDIPDAKQVKQGYAKRYWQKLILDDNLTTSQYQNKIALIKQNNSNAVIAPYFTNQSGEKIGLSNFLYVKLKAINDTIILKQQVVNYNATIVYQDQFMPLWFVVSVGSESSHNAMELANIFYESGLFQYAEPDLMVDDRLNCVNDTYFSSQWGFNNTGQYNGTIGIDIKACDAWQISTGNNVPISVIPAQPFR